MNEYHRCPRCGSKIGSMQVHTMEHCERAQEAAGLAPPFPLKEWPKEGKCNDESAKRKLMETLAGSRY